MKNVKTLFIGTGEFAVPILRAALEHPLLEIVGIVTQPDRPAGRNQELKPPPVKQFIIDNLINVPLEQPERIRISDQDLLEKYEPELILVASYGQIIPNSILAYPKYKALNFHGSLLPELRGAVPVPLAILKGLDRTGVTLQVMAEKMDEGPIISSASCQIESDETAESLMSKLSLLAVKILDNDIQKWVNGEITPIDQDNSAATYCYKEDISKDKAEIIYKTDINLAERMVRAFYPWPVAWIRLENGKVLKIFRAKFKDFNSDSSDLKITRDGSTLLLNLETGVLELLEVQLEGKKRDVSKNYLFLSEV